VFGTIGDSHGRSLHQNQIHSDSGANGTNQIAYTWQLGNGVTFNVGADDRRVAPVANLSTNTGQVGTEPTTFRHGELHPNPHASLKVAQAWGRWAVSAILNRNAATYYTQNPANPSPVAFTGTSQCGYPSDKWGWAVLTGIEIPLPALGPGSRFGAYAGYSVGATRYAPGSNLRSPGLFQSGNVVAIGHTTDAVYINGSSLQLTTGWSAGGSYEHFWSRNFSTGIYGAYAEIEYNNTVVNGAWFCNGPGVGTPSSARTIIPQAGTPCDPSFKYWIAGVHNNWWPLGNSSFRLAVDVMYTQVETGYEGFVSLNKAQGARPTGIYATKDLGITSVVFRAQRNFGGGD
jgi:hypothetical protein